MYLLQLSALINSTKDQEKPQTRFAEPKNNNSNRNDTNYRLSRQSLLLQWTSMKVDRNESVSFTKTYSSLIVNEEFWNRKEARNSL